MGSKQWGLGGSSGTFKFPLAFSSTIYAAVCIKRASAGDYSPWTGSWTKTTLQYGAGNSSSLIVIGL